MANKLYEESNIQAIADAIRAKGQTGTMTVAQMAGKIAAIETDPVLVNKTVTSNGTYNASDDSADGYDKVVVNVSAPTPTLQNKTVTPSTSQQSVTADAGYDGLDTVTVNAMPSGMAGTPTATKSVSNHVATVTPQVTNSAGYISSGTKTGTAVTVNPADLGAVVPGGTKNITENGTYDVTNYASANVNVPTGGGGTCTVTLKNTGDASYAYVRYGSTVYYTGGDEIAVNAGEKIYIRAYGGSSNTIYINGNGIPGGSTELAYTVSNDVAVSFKVVLGDGATVRLATNGYVYTQNKTVTSNGTVTADTGYDGLGEVTVNVGGGGAVLLPVTSVSGTTLTFDNTSGYSHYCIFYQAITGYSAQSAVYGIFSYIKPDDNKYHAVYYMSYGGAKFNFTTNSSEDEVKRQGNNFTISSTYQGIGLTWITNTNMGRYYGFFWN